MDTVRYLRSNPRRIVQQWRVPFGHWSLRRPVPLWLPYLVQPAHVWRRRFEQSDKAEEWAQRNLLQKADMQQMRADNANPRIRSCAAPGGSLAQPSPASQLFVASSASFASILSARPIPARQPLTPLNINSALPLLPRVPPSRMCPRVALAYRPTPVEFNGVPGRSEQPNQWPRT